MSGDIATLGIAINSQQAVTAAAALDKLATAAGGAGTATDKLSAATGKSETQIRAIQSMADRVGVSFGTMNARVDAASTGHTKLQQSASAATTSIATLANAAAGNGGSGGSGGSLVSATDRSNSSLDRLANTLTRRVLFAAAANEVRQFAAYVWNLNGAIAATADAAQRSSIGGQQFQGLQSAASNKGIDNNTFNGAMVAFNAQVDLAKHGLGDLKVLFNSNGKTVSDTATNFGIVADMVRNAGSEAQKFSILQQAGLPATAAMAKYMEQGASSILKQADAAGKLTASQLRDAQELNDKWNELWTNFENWGKRAVVAVFDKAKELKNISTPATGMTGELSGVYNTGFDLPGSGKSDTLETPAQRAARLLRSGQGSQLTSGTNATSLYAGTALADPAKPTADPNLQKQINAQLQARLGLQTQLGDVDAIVAAKEAELAAATLNLVGPNKKVHDALIDMARAQAENSLVQNQAAIGVFNLDKANKAAADTLQSWKTRGLLDPTNTQQMAAAQTNLAKSIEQTGQNALVAGAPLEGLQRLANEAGSVRTQLDTFATTSMNAVTPALRDMLNGTTSLSAGFKALGLTVVQALEDAMIKIMIVKPMIDALSSSLNSSGILGFLGVGGTASNATDGIGGFGPTAPKGYASGGYTGTGGKYEPAGIVHKGEFVMNAAATSRIGVGNLTRLQGYADGGLVGGGRAGNDNASVAPSNVHVTVGVSVDNDGNLQAYVKDVSQQMASASINGFVGSPAFVQHVGVAANSAKTLRVGK